MAAPLVVIKDETASNGGGVVRVNPLVVGKKPDPAVVQQTVPYREFLKLHDMYGELRNVLGESGVLTYTTVRGCVDRVGNKFDEVEKLMKDNSFLQHGHVVGELRELRDMLEKLDHDREHQSSMYGLVQQINKRIYESEKLMKDLQGAVPYFNDHIEKTNDSVLRVVAILKDRDAMVKADLDFLVKDLIDTKVSMTTRMVDRETKWRSMVDDLILLALPKDKCGGSGDDDYTSGVEEVDQETNDKKKQRKRALNHDEKEETDKIQVFGKMPRWG